jgi:hypothetical protein
VGKEEGPGVHAHIPVWPHEGYVEGCGGHVQRGVECGQDTVRSVKAATSHNSRLDEGQYDSKNEQLARPRSEREAREEGVLREEVDGRNISTDLKSVIWWGILSRTVMSSASH